jgi:hypothetical protein
MNGPKNVTASFTLLNYSLKTSTTGNGTIDPAAGNFPYGSPVTLTARPNTGSQFSSWGGDCLGVTGATCNLTMNGPKNVTANFTPVVVQQFTLTLAKDGNGTGTVGALPYSSSGQYTAGTNVSVKASPGPNCKFTGWSGACTGTGSCSVKMDKAKKVTASFALMAPSCDDTIADLQKKVAADKRHVKYGHGIQEALRLYAAAHRELARAEVKVGPNDKKYLSAVKEFENGKAAFCAGRYWRAAHEFWEAYQIAHKILQHHRR